MEGSSVEKNSYNENNYYLSYLKYMKNLSRDKFFNSDGNGYSGRQILFLGDSHGWGEGSPNYQGSSSGFNIHAPWIHNKGFFNRVIDYLYEKMDTKPWRCIPLDLDYGSCSIQNNNGNCSPQNNDYPETIHLGNVGKSVQYNMNKYDNIGKYAQINKTDRIIIHDEVTYTTVPTFAKGRYWIYQVVASDYSISDKEALNAFCNAEARCDFYSAESYSYNSDIGLFGKNVFVLAPDIDRGTSEFYRVTPYYGTYCGMTKEIDLKKYKFFNNKCGGIDEKSRIFLIIQGQLNTIPDWLKTAGQRIYIPELGAFTIQEAAQLFEGNGNYIKLYIQHIQCGNSNVADPLKIDFNTLEFRTYPGMLIYKSYYGESCVYMDVNTCTRYVILSLITNREYGAKARIELISDSSVYVRDANSDYYGKEIPSVYKLSVPGDNRSPLIPALNAIVDYADIKGINSGLSFSNMDNKQFNNQFINQYNNQSSNQTSNQSGNQSEATGFQQNTNSIIIDTSDHINANQEEFYIIDFKQKKKGRIKLSVAGPGSNNTGKHPLTNTEVIMSRGIICGNMDLFRNWSLGGHSTGAWLGHEESFWKECRNHIQDAAKYMTAKIRGIVIQAPLVNEWLKQTPIDVFKSRLTETINILECSNVIILTTLGLKDREFGISGENVAQNHKSDEKITFEQYAIAVKDWTESQIISGNNNVTFLDCRRCLKDLVVQGVLKPDDLYINNGHPSPVANEIIADMLITAIKFKY